MDCSSLRSACLVAWGCAAFSAAFPVHGASAAADDFPNKPIRIVVGFTPGSTPDLSTRLISQKLAESWKQPVVVDNRAGAAGIIAAQITAGANPDGYTLLSVSASHASGPATRAKLPYDTLTDFAGISRTLSAPSLLVVSPSLGVKSVKELIALAKAKPGQLNFSSAGIGSITHFAAELFKSMAAIDVTHIPYKGVAQAMSEIISGQVQFLISSLPNTLPLVKQGKLVALGVSSPSRMPAIPDIPTIAESGLPGYQWEGWYGLLAPGKTPRPVIARLNKDITRVLTLPEMTQRWATLGAQAAPTTPEQFDKIVAAQVALITKLARAAKIKVD
ncbi:MAG: hypothetical protein A3G24_07030 [Betaproteobacteria bacterium RIFCSPLOWO2_12_FULL_62_13]|nr:MAG: hypothetical protein A3G24_07030 [Betaproteobacteria bacterium RIFCSPLOWO2_12_FULL_62_13]